MEITYRRAIATDAAALLAMMRALDGETRYMLYEPGERQMPLRALEDALDGQDSLCLLALAGEEIVGYLMARRGSARRIRHNACIVVGVRTQWHHQGIGRTLFCRLEEWAREQGLRRLELTVAAENAPAIAVYEPAGFVREGIKRDALCVDGQLMDEIMMARLLPAQGQEKLYCEECNLVFTGERCPCCGGKRVRPPKGEDLCFLVEKEMIWSDLLSEVLRDNGIPFLKKGRMGAGLAMQAGFLGEHFRFYVNYENLAEAAALVDALFVPTSAEEE